MNAGPTGPEAAPPVQTDVRLIVSGNFSEDALGPDAYRAILARLAAAPQAYLKAFLALMRERTDAGQLSTLHLPWFLRLLARTDPAAAQEGARELLAVYAKAAQEVGGPAPRARGPAAETARIARRDQPATEHDKLIDRLASRTEELQRLLEP